MLIGKLYLLNNNPFVLPEGKVMLFNDHPKNVLLEQQADGYMDSDSLDIVGEISVGSSFVLLDYLVYQENPTKLISVRILTSSGIVGWIDIQEQDVSLVRESANAHQ